MIVKRRIALFDVLAFSGIALVVARASKAKDR
jgi:hypothetical protein